MVADAEGPPIAIVFFLFNLLAFGTLAWKGRSERRRLLLHELSPNSVLLSERRHPIGLVQEGDVVKVVGNVHCAGEALTSPLGGRRCAFYRLRVESNWNPVVYVDEERDCAFHLQDESGQILVRLGDLRGWVALQPVRARRRDLRALLRERGVRTPLLLLRATELVIPEGGRVAVLGEARWEDDPSPVAADAYRGAGRRLVLRPVDPTRGMAISDDPAAMDPEGA